MLIHGIVTSVDYAPLLERSIDHWVAGLATLVVVTSWADDATAELAHRAGAMVHRTDAFYEDGALFNKARAMQEARSLLPSSDWHVFLDADVVPPADWREQLEAAAPQVGTLHGAKRVFEDGRPVPDGELAGFFQLFHSSDPGAAKPLACDFYHGGNYDSDFTRRWEPGLQRILPLTLIHLGETGVNWCGVGNVEAMRQLRENRKAGRRWRTEVLPKP